MVLLLSLLLSLPLLALSQSCVLKQDCGTCVQSKTGNTPCVWCKNPTAYGYQCTDQGSIVCPISEQMTDGCPMGETTIILIVLACIIGCCCFTVCICQKLGCLKDVRVRPTATTPLTPLKRPCPGCAGRGYVIDSVLLPNGDSISKQNTCSVCRGAKEIPY